MSYILDALNKSEQERQQREHGVSLQPLTGVPHPGDGTARWLPLAAAAIVVAAIGIFAAVYFLMKVKTPPAPTAQPVPVATAARAPSAPAPAPASVAPPVRKPAIPATAASVAAAPAAVENPASSAPAAAPAAARAGTSESVKSLYQRKGMAAQQAKAEAAAEGSHSAPITDNTAPDDVIKAGAAVKTFDADKTASVQTQDAARQSAQTPAAEKSTVNQKALDAELAREREATRDSELAARVQAELERMQAQDAKAAEKQAAAVAKAQPVQDKPKPTPTSTPRQAASAAPDPDANVPLATQLPADVQKRIPNIAFDAHVYAGRTNAGFVILNDKKRYPGDTIASGLTVERITEDGVILNLSGTRFKLNSMSSWIN